MYLGDIPVDVKSLSYDQCPTKYIRKIINRAAEAFQKQHAKMAGLSIGIALITLGLAERRASRIGRKEFCTAIENGTAMLKEGKKPVLLFYHDPWTGDVQARTIVLKDLKRNLS